MSFAYWVCAAVTAISAFVSLGYSFVAVRDSAGAESAAARYAFSRSLALAVAAAAVPITASPSWLRAVALVMILVQAGDAIVGAMLRDRLKTLGPAFTAAANLVALVYFTH